MKQYYIYLEQQEGPFTYDQLKEKALGGETPVWFDGLPEWQKAGDIEELKALFAPVPPPYQGIKTEKAPATPPFVKKETPSAKSVVGEEPSIVPELKPGFAERLENYHPKWEKKSTYWKWIGIAFLVLVIAGAIVIPWVKNLMEKTEFQANPTSYFSGTVEGKTNKLIGGIWAAKVTLYNRSNFTADNVRCVVTYVRKNGNVYKEEVIDSGPILPHSNVSVAAPNSDAGMELQVRVQRVQSTEAGVY